MEEDIMVQNIDEITKRELERSKRFYDAQPEEATYSSEPVDVYQQTQDRIKSVNQKAFPKGSSYAVNMATDTVIDGHGTEGLAKAYNRIKDDVDALKARGERGRADLMRQQYMQEHFLPAVEIVVNSTSPDEVLNSEKALDELDKYVLLEGAGRGYTASYIRQAYGNVLGQKEGRSDASVRSSIMRINSLLDDGQNRTAYGIASKLKEKIDRGDAQASDDDYELIGRIVAFFA